MLKSKTMRFVAPLVPKLWAPVLLTAALAMGTFAGTALATEADASATSQKTEQAAGTSQAASQTTGQTTTQKTSTAAKKSVEKGKAKSIKGTRTFAIKAASSLCITNAGSTMKSGKQLTLKKTKGKAARFYLQKTKKGSKWVYIRNAASGHALTAKDGKVVQMKTTKAKNQQWQLLKMKDGSYAIKSRSTGLRMGVESAKSGAGLVLQKASNAKTQRFKVKKAKAAYMLSHDKMISILDSASGASKIKMVNCSYKIPASAKRKLQSAINQTLPLCDSTFGFVLVDLRTGEGFSYNADATIFSASALKGPYLASVNKYEPKKANAYSSHYYQLIHNSSNEEYAYLRGVFGSSSFKKYVKYSGVKDVDPAIHYQPLMVKSLAKLWASNWEYFNSGAKNAKKIRGLYKHIIGSEICTVWEGVPGYTTYTKGGWVGMSGSDSYNSCGIVIRPNGTRYLLSVMTTLNPYNSDKYQMQRLIRTIDKTYAAVSKES